MIVTSLKYLLCATTELGNLCKVDHEILTITFAVDETKAKIYRSGGLTKNTQAYISFLGCGIFLNNF